MAQQTTNPATDEGISPSPSPSPLTVRLRAGVNGSSSLRILLQREIQRLRAANSGSKQLQSTDNFSTPFGSVDDDAATATDGQEQTSEPWTIVDSSTDSVDPLFSDLCTLNSELIHCVDQLRCRQAEAHVILTNQDQSIKNWRAQLEAEREKNKVLNEQLIVQRNMLQEYGLEMSKMRAEIRAKSSSQEYTNDLLQSMKLEMCNMREEMQAKLNSQRQTSSLRDGPSLAKSSRPAQTFDPVYGHRLSKRGRFPYDYGVYTYRCSGMEKNGHCEGCGDCEDRKEKIEKEDEKE